MACIFYDKPCVFFATQNASPTFPRAAETAPVSGAYMPDIFAMSPSAHPLAAYHCFISPLTASTVGIYTRKIPYTSFFKTCMGVFRYCFCRTALSVRAKSKILSTDYAVIRNLACKVFSFLGFSRFLPSCPGPNHRLRLHRESL